jgi:hypothetical protein
VESFIKLIADTWGLAGLLILSPLIGMIYLWKANLKLQADLQGLNDKRIDDSIKTSDKMLAMVKEQASLSTETNLALDRLGDALSILQNSGRIDLGHIKAGPRG